MYLNFEERIANSIEITEEDMKEYLEWTASNNEEISKESFISWANEALYISDWIYNTEVEYTLTDVDLVNFINEIKEND